LPFGAGYQVLSDKANILLATRTGTVLARAKPRPKKMPVSEVRPIEAAVAEAKPAPRPIQPAPPAAKVPAPPRTTVYLHDSVSKTAPVSVAATSPSPRRALIALEVEELRIRRDPTLTREERMRQLRDIWKKQLAVMGKTSA